MCGNGALSSVYKYLSFLEKAMLLLMPLNLKFEVCSFYALSTGLSEWSLGKSQ